MTMIYSSKEELKKMLEHAERHYNNNLFWGRQIAKIKKMINQYHDLKLLGPNFFCPIADECNIKNLKNCADCLKKLHKISFVQINV